MSDSKCKGRDFFFFFLGKFEENFSVNWPWNKHDCMSASLICSHCNCLVSCIGNADCLSICVSDGLFHKLWWISELCYIANAIYTDCCYCGQLYKMNTHSKCYVLAYIILYACILVGSWSLIWETYFIGAEPVSFTQHNYHL